MADDIYLGLEYSNVNKTDADRFFDSWIYADKSGISVCGVDWVPSTNTLGVYIGLDDKTPAEEVNKIIDRINAVAQDALGKGAAVRTLTKGEKCTTGKDARAGKS